MKYLLSTIILLLLTGHTTDEANFTPVTVLELFTSQGCSSCPPADALLKTVKQNNKENVIVLSYHVDYWNYIGWKDPFSKTKFGDKQRKYGGKFNSRSIYTPQVVVNGNEHFVGSNKTIMQRKLDQYKDISARNTIVLSDIKSTDNAIAFRYSVKGAIENKRLRVALVIDNRVTIVKRGENRNRTLNNSNIVVEDLYLNLDNATGNGSITIPNIVIKSDKLSLVALVERDNFDIVGGTQVYL